MPHRLVVPEILEALAEGREQDLVQVLGDLHPNDAASLLSGLDEPKITEVMSLLPIEMERDVFEYFDPDVQEAIVRGSGQARLKQLLAAMASDDRAEFMDRLSPPVQESMLPLLTKAAREDLIRREQFEDDQVGALLSTEYSAIDPGRTAQQAIEDIRRQAPGKETIYYGFVVDDGKQLLGLVSLRDLIMAPAHQKVGDLMVSDVVSVEATEDQEVAANMIREYDLLAIPVTDHQNRLLGIITHDDAADILEEEAEEDLEKMAGIAAEERSESYLGATISAQFRRRIPVLTMLAVSFVLIGLVIEQFEEVIRTGPGVIILLLPMIMATGGNVGNQTSTAVILGLKHDLEPRAVLQVLSKELRVSLCLAAVLSVIAGLEAFYLLKPGEPNPLLVCAAITLAMALHVVTAAILGAVIPLGCAALGRDPSMVAHPALATVADLSGALIYFVTVVTLVPIGA